MSVILKLGTLDLTDVTSQWVLREGVDPGSFDPANGNAASMTANRRRMVFSFRMRAADADGIARLVQAIHEQLRRAKLSTSPNSGRDPVAVQLQLGSESAYFDLMRDDSGECGYLTLGPVGFSAIAQGIVRSATLTLTTTAYGRGARLVATNLLTNSADYTGDDYTRTNVTATSGAALAPNGDAVANAILETTTNGVHTVSQSITKDASAVDYTLALYGKPDGRDIIDLMLQDSSGDNGASMTVNLATGAIVTAAATFGSGFTLLGSGVKSSNRDYYRPWLAATSNSDTTIEAVIALRKDAETTSYAGDTSDGIWLWGLTLNPNASEPGPYLETGDSLTLVNGVDPGPYLYDIPGDVEALPRITLSDVSTNSAVIQDIRLGWQAVDFAGDFAAVLSITPETGASSTDDDSVSTNIASLIAGPTAQQLGTFTKPSGAPSTDGRLLPLLRVRDHSPGLGAPSNLSALSGAIRQIQSKTYDSGSTQLSSHTVTFPQTATSGNLLRATAAMPSGGSPTTPTGWTAGITPISRSGVAKLAEYYKVSDGTETSLTITVSAACTMAIVVEEVAGIAATTPADVNATNDGSTISFSSISTGTTSATAQANEYAVAAAFSTAGDEDRFDDTLGWSNGFRSTYINETSQGSTDALSLANKILSSTGTVTTGFSQQNGAYVAYVATYKGLTSAAPSLPAGTYQLTVAAVDAAGNVGIPSKPVTISLAATGAIALTWVAPTIGPAVDHYRVYWQRSGSWSYFDTADDTPQYILSTESSPDGTTAPALGSTQFGEYRLKVALGGSSRWIVGPWRSTKRANSAWELLPMPTFTGTTQPSRWGDAALGWTIAVECRHETSTPVMDVDCVWLIPDRPQLRERYKTTEDIDDLATCRDWAYDLRPDLSASAVLYETDTSTVAGHALPEGRLLFGPGAVQLVTAVTVGDKVSDVTNAKFKLGIELTPRYLYLAS